MNMGYQKQKFIDYPNDGYTVLKAEHLNHMEDGIASALIPEGRGSIVEGVDLLSDSFEYWSDKFIQYHHGSAQTFGENTLEKIVGTPANYENVNSFNVGRNYIVSPLIKLDPNFSNELKTKSFLRQVYIFNASGQLLFDCGNTKIGEGDTIWNQGFASSHLESFKNSLDQELYPNIINTLTVSKFILTNETIAELNAIYRNIVNASATEFIPGETIYLSFNLKTLSPRPSNEDTNADIAAWLLKESLRCTLVEGREYSTYELTSLVLPSTIYKKYYSSPLLNNAFVEMGEFKHLINPKNIITRVNKSTTVYSSTMTEDFYPSAYHGYYIEGGFAISDLETPVYTGVSAYNIDGRCYKISRPIPIDLSDSDTTYTCTGYLRHFALLDAKGSLLYRGQEKSAAGKTWVITRSEVEALGVFPDSVKYLCVSNVDEPNGAQNATNFKLTAVTVKNSSTYELPNLRLNSSQTTGGGSGTGTGASNIVDLTNVDRIVAIGDSYTESHYTIKDKSWISKVSLLSDYNYDNFAISGDTYRGQLNKIRTGTYAYNSTSGITWEQLHPTHTILISKTNDTKYMDCQQFIYDMVAALETTKGLGAIPIIATEYHVSDQNYTQTAFDYYAKKYGGYYVDLTEKIYTLRGPKDYAPFWGGSHPGTRPNHIFSDVITDYINKNLPRPYSAIKIFRARDTSLVSNLDNYLFGNIEERAEKFKEISICHSALREPKYYDNCTDKGYSQIESEYCKLIANLPVSFNKVCLIDVILPTTVHDISEVQLITNELDGVNCYVKDILAEPYPSPAFCRRFDIPYELTDDQVKVGNTYTSDKSLYSGSLVKYTVVEILRDQQVESDSGFVNGTILICSGNRTTSAYTDSTLTLTSGQGDATLNCSYEAVGLSSDYPAGKQDIGHYIPLDYFGFVDGQILKRAMDYDKITFLLVSDGEFNLSKLQVEFKGNITKTRSVPQYNNTLSTNYCQDQVSMLAHTKFDNDNITYWKKATNTSQACGLIPGIPADSCLPKGISKMVTLTPETGTIVQPLTNYITARPTQNAVHKVRVWARYFPDIFNSETQQWPEEASITEDSFDWAKLNIQLYQNSNCVQSNTVKLTKLVGLHWTEVEVDIVLPPTIANTWYIGLAVEDKPIQIAYCEVI
jgi:hypothetical protein